ncbi:MAG: J domain-containing protein [Synechococcaceae cyanobacterium]|nr:J domain-containing protein [Synechococcaceae cyanobacterium]
MFSLLTVITITLLALALLWAAAALGWWLVGRCADPLLERCREAGQRERILRAAAFSEAAWQLQRQRRRRQSLRRRLHDLDGRPLLLDEHEVEAFRRLCRRELGLTAASSWPEVRRHWRRCSLDWHPDRGGEPQAWLRRQRAYEALKILRQPPGQPSTTGKPAAQPSSLPQLSAAHWLPRWRRRR